MSQDYLPLIKPKDIKLKNTGKLIVFSIRGKEYEMRGDTLKQLCEIADFVRTSKHPTEWISGYEEIVKEGAIELWPEDTDDLP